MWICLRLKVKGLGEEETAKQWLVPQCFRLFLSRREVGEQVDIT